MASTTKALQPQPQAPAIALPRTRRLPAQTEALQLLWSSIRSVEKRKLPVSPDVCALFIGP